MMTAMTLITFLEHASGRSNEREICK